MKTFFFPADDDDAEHWNEDYMIIDNDDKNIIVSYAQWTMYWKLVFEQLKAIFWKTQDSSLIRFTSYCAMFVCYVFMVPWSVFPICSYHQFLFWLFELLFLHYLFCSLYFVCCVCQRRVGLSNRNPFKFVLRKTQRKITPFIRKERAPL